jgi:cysteinyl-tRNA synthetase
MLMTHYREPIDFSVARLEEAERKLRDWRRAAAGAAGKGKKPPEPSVLHELEDDLNFHRASVAMDVLARRANREPDSAAAACLAATLDFLGFSRDGLVHEEAGDPGVEAAIEARLAALEGKNFPEADRIRADLLASGIQLMDYKDETGRRRTRWERK